MLSNQHAQDFLQILVYRALILCDKYRSSFLVSACFVNVAHSASGSLVGWNSDGRRRTIFIRFNKDPAAFSLFYLLVVSSGTKRSQSSVGKALLAFLGVYPTALKVGSREYAMMCALNVI